MAAKEIIQTIVGRVILLIHSSCTVGLTSKFLDNGLYWLFVFLLLFQVFEMIYMVGERQCEEYNWISLSTVCYLIAVVPPLWTVELKVLSDFQNNITSPAQCTNKTPGLGDLTVVSREIPKQSFLLVIMLHRWIIPRGGISRDALSNLIFVLFALASDIMELFELFDNKDVKSNGVIGYAILAVWTLSLTQMSFVLTNTRLSRRARPTNVCINHM